MDMLRDMLKVVEEDKAGDRLRRIEREGGTAKRESRTYKAAGADSREAKRRRARQKEFA